MSSKPPKKLSVARTPVERTKLRASPVQVQVRSQLLERPTAASSGLFSRAEVSKQLTVTDIGKLLKKTGRKPMGGTGGGGGGEPDVHVELSPAIPWVDGRGWLEAAGTLQSWSATTTIGFVPDKPSQEQGILYIWMDGLTEGDAYVAEIRVGGFSVNQQSPGTYNIGASDAAHADITQSGANQTLSVLIPAVGGPMSLITIETKGLGGWLLDDVRVLHIGKLG